MTTKPLFSESGILFLFSLALCLAFFFHEEWIAGPFLAASAILFGIGAAKRWGAK